MLVNMNVAISDIIYARVRRLARAQQQPLGQVVERLLLTSLPDDDEIAETLDETEQALRREIAAYHGLHPTLKSASALRALLRMAPVYDLDTRLRFPVRWAGFTRCPHYSASDRH